MSHVSKLFRGIGHYRFLWDEEEMSSLKGGVKSLSKVYKPKKAIHPVCTPTK